ncbi:DUF5107 domain-containing protein [Rubellicoccus peritrichatus]|uniref:DUF5107 domain-containing protein n=1 Tax=Rubellicoccus peritrichatus TaxID=3080537 RepID=A0AAQ3LD40_9BACT|nr:DUF5107 domain-containing protein [Puniceicoccus sp. CR14]WOO43581.1 DUF5107 domain-containing protein [Puniceicoccus sp. CR14]
MSNNSAVIAQTESLVIPTYPVGSPEKYPLFFEKRVYQGSSGKVYPVPFIDKVYDEPVDQTYQSVRLENDFVRLVLLPEIGGRIFKGQDKTNNDYDFFYRQDVIKPALVGLAGPWISGGVEFNWPQHHRPGTFLPSDYWIEHESDGSCTVWMSEHDPIQHLRGCYGIRLRPDSALIELKARLYNRTSLRHTFLWWANVAARVHDNYQSFFPEDVHYVADHAVRAMSSFPNAENHYYGVDYQNRGEANDLRWYKNIPVPTSYMICDTEFDFFGGYDYSAAGGFLHIADRSVAPGKKQWTWGNHAFGWAWDRELTDANGPYVELMAGVYTDNQPDFTYLQPGEVKRFSQYWWPYQAIGTIQQANERLAIHLEVDPTGQIDAGVASAECFEVVHVRLLEGTEVLEVYEGSLQPGQPYRFASKRLKGDCKSALKVEILEASGSELLSHQPVTLNDSVRREVATEPKAPAELKSADELYFAAEHLEQYRHPTRSPILYWDEAIRRDPGDARCHLAKARNLLQRGIFNEAEPHLLAAMTRLTARHPNPETGEAHYLMGYLKKLLGQDYEAAQYLTKATWDYAWRAPAHTLLAQLELKAGSLRDALTQAEGALDTNQQSNHARILAALSEQKLGLAEEAHNRLQALLAEDPLEPWAIWSLGNEDRFLQATRNDAQIILDLSFDLAACGQYGSAVQLIEWHHSHEVESVAVPNPMERGPMTHYCLAWLYAKMGDNASASQCLEKAKEVTTCYFFPSRLEEQIVLDWVLQTTEDAHAAYALGNYCYDRKRHEEAIAHWEYATRVAPELATAYRNLGIAYWNIRQDGEAARAAYLKALELTPSAPRLISEYTQLCEKLEDVDQERLAFLEERLESVFNRDDTCVAYATLLNRTGQADRALKLLEERRFHPWEGGEGKVLAQYTDACLRLGKQALETTPEKALDFFGKAMDTPENLGEAYHLLQAKADVNYWKGMALKKLNRHEEARSHFEASANEAGDFQNMAVVSYSSLSCYRGLSLIELNQQDKATQLFEGMRAYAIEQKAETAKIDYFATSLPNLLVFEEDIELAKNKSMDELLRMAEEGLEIIENAVSHSAS